MVGRLVSGGLLVMQALATAGCGTALVTGKNTVGVLPGGAMEFASTTGDALAEGGLESPSSSAAEVVYKRRLKQAEMFDLHLEVPVVIAPHMKPAFLSPELPASYAALFVIPGVSLQMKSRLSMSFGIGGGFARIREGDRLLNGADNAGPRSAMGAVGQFSLGLELQVTPRVGVGVSVRPVWPQGRRFLTRPHPENLEVFRAAVTIGGLVHF